MQGQSNHFTRYAPEDIPYGQKRYQNETRRLYRVLEKHLQDTGHDYLVANKCTIADIAHIGWITAAAWAGVDIEEFPILKSWKERMLARPGVEKGRIVPDGQGAVDRVTDPAKMKELAEKTKAWVQQGMKEDAEKQK